MLENLHIKNVALIEEGEVSFGQGLNILTGETGAGKSMLIDSIQFVLGGRVSKDFLRKEQKMAVVEALFSVQSTAFLESLEEKGIPREEDGTVLVSRSLNSSGKSISRVNGTTVTQGMLKEIGGDLIDIYGQHEHQSLLNPAKHIRLLDRFCGETFPVVYEQYGQSYDRRKAIEGKLSSLLGDESQREQRIDILTFQKEEIEEAHLFPLEEEELLEQKKRLSNMERLIRLTGESVALLYDGDDETPSVCDQMGIAMHRITEGAALDSALESYGVALQDAYAIIEDAARGMKRYGDTFEEDPEALAEIEERLQMIYRLKRKYGGSIEAVLTFYEQVVEELAFLRDSHQIVGELMVEKEKEEKLLEELSTKLTALRKKTALWVEKEIETSLWDMEMKHSRFEIRIEERSEWKKDGRDQVEFLISANQGEDVKPLAKIASGGEMSRVMLALKAVLVDADDIETFIFDEIDTGVSGRTAAKVGEKMHLIGEKRQILCITHLPQIAAMAQKHFLIEKEVVGGKTVTKVLALSEEESVLEVARLIGGATTTEATLAAARELKNLGN